MAVIGNGTTISFAGGSPVDCTDISISASATAVDSTTLNSAVSTAIQGRPVVTGTATIHCDNAAALSLAQKFAGGAGGTPSTVPITVAIAAPGAGTGGIDFSGSAVITGFNPTYASDQVMSAQVSWQYTGEITASRA